MKQIHIFKSRTNIVSVSIGYDVSNDTITSEIRVDKDPESELIATWNVSYLTDGTDGEVVLTLDDSVTDLVEYTKGYMDFKRVSGGEPLNVFDDPIEVLFKNIVTI